MTRVMLIVLLGLVGMGCAHRGDRLPVLPPDTSPIQEDDWREYGQMPGHGEW